MLTPIKAIRAKCLDCMCDNAAEVKRCISEHCPLWPYRMGHKPRDIEGEPATIFRKPTLEEVRAYCQERRNGVDAQRFLDFYEARGWMTGRTKIRDWKACVRTWERNDNRRTGGVSDAHGAGSAGADEDPWAGLTDEQRREYERIANDPEWR